MCESKSIKKKTNLKVGNKADVETIIGENKDNNKLQLTAKTYISPKFQNVKEVIEGHMKITTSTICKELSNYVYFKRNTQNSCNQI